MSLAGAAPRAIPRTCCTTPSTTGPGSRATRRPSASPGTPRTRSARWSSSTRPTSARRSEARRVLCRGRVGEGRLGRDRAALRRGDRGQRGGLGDARADQRGPLRRRLAREGAAHRPERDASELLDAHAYKASLELGRVRARSHCSLTLPLHVRDGPATASAMLAEVGASSIEELFADMPGGRAPRPPARAARRQARGRGLRAAGRARRAQHAAPRTRSASSARGCTTTTCRRSSTRSRSARSS